MKRLLTLFTLYPIITFGQLPDNIRHDPALEAQLSKLLLADNQSLDSRTKNLIVLTTIIPDYLLSKRDSLFKESKYLNGELIKTIGAERAKNEGICIAYYGQQSDKHRLFFNYDNGRFNGQVPVNDLADTLMSPDPGVIQNLTYLPGNTFVRHEKKGNQLTIRFTILTNSSNYDSITAVSPIDGARLITDYLQYSFPIYTNLTIDYLNKRTAVYIRYKVEIQELILLTLAQYAKEKRLQLRREYNH